MVWQNVSSNLSHTARELESVCRKRRWALLRGERGMGRGIVSTVLAMIVGNAIIYACGVAWLGSFIGMAKAVAVGVLPFLYGDLAKIIVAAVLMPAAWYGVSLLRRGADDEAE